MSFADERKHIENRLRDNWDSWTVPIQYENTPVLMKGTEALKEMDEVEKFIRLTITTTGGEQRDVGGNADRYFGIITVQILTKAGIGNTLGRKLADQVYQIFNRQSFGECITTQTTEIESFPNTQDGWYQINVNTPFYRDQEYVPVLTNGQFT